MSIFGNRFVISDCKYGKELIKMGFPENLIIRPEDCKIYYEHCKTYNMKFLEGSYGTLVHKSFDKYFKHIERRNDEQYEIQQKLTCKKGLDGNYEIDGVNVILDHTNLFQSKLYDDIYFVTSSPYGAFDNISINNLKDYPYGAYIIHPNFLDYHGFLDRLGKLRPPLWDINLAFTNATEEQVYEISKQILHELDIFMAFGKIPR